MTVQKISGCEDFNPFFLGLPSRFGHEIKKKLFARFITITILYFIFSISFQVYKNREGKTSGACAAKVEENHNNVNET